jgi:hypothetical protein
VDDAAELPLGWIRVSVDIGDEANVAQDADIGDDAYLYFCDDCQDDVLKTLSKWTKPPVKR